MNEFWLLVSFFFGLLAGYILSKDDLFGRDEEKKPEPVPWKCDVCRFEWYGIYWPHCIRCGAVMETEE